MEKRAQNSEGKDASKDASKEASKPVILLFSTRERIGDILNVALMQCNYRIIHSNMPYLAMIKANQFLPDLIIADITPNNTKDTLLITRLQKSFRTKQIPVLVVIPAALQHLLEPLKKEAGDDAGVIHVLEYPFNFADLLKNIESIMSSSRQTVPYTGSPEIDTANADRVIAPKLYDPNVPLEAKLRAVESVIHRQWAFPFTVIKALDIIGSDASCCNELAKCIETDLAASTAILKVANAVYYAKRGSRVTEVKEAVVRLGFRETNNLLACLAPSAVATGRVFNVGTGKSHTLNEVYAAIAGLLGFTGKPIYGPPRASDIRYSLADNSRASKELAYQPKAHFHDGLQKTVVGTWSRKRNSRPRRSDRGAPPHRAYCRMTLPDQGRSGDQTMDCATCCSIHA